MFNIGFSELLLVLIIAYVIVGPDDLPKVVRWLGRTVRKARRLIREFRASSGWDDIVAETAEVRKEIDETVRNANPAEEIREAGQFLKEGMNGSAERPDENRQQEDGGKET